MKNMYAGLTGVIFILLLVFWFSNNQQEEFMIHNFEKIQLSKTFYAEGAGIGDLNKDRHLDVIAGPYWYEGPDFEDRHAYYEPREFDPMDYSDNFIVDVDDVNEDGWDDILVIGFPGKEAYWYENPQGEVREWERHLIYPEVDNESPLFTDITGDGKLDLVSHSDGYLGYAVVDSSDPKEPWSFRKVSAQQEWGQFNHGFGVGDINNDGHEDILMNDGWWENPGEQSDTLWKQHRIDFGPGGAQMFAYDVNEDGRNDVITSHDAHGWGLVWYRVEESPREQLSFQKQLIMGESRDDNPYGVRFSQPHALELVDMDKDGTLDLLSGKRWWAHGPDGDPEPNAPAVLYWFKPDQNGDKIEFIPYEIDDNSGAGVEIETGDLTGNGYPDIAVSNKKGTFIFLNHPVKVDRAEWEAHQPEPKGVD